MKLLLIAPPSAHRNRVSAFLARRGAEVEVRSIGDPSTLQAADAVDAVDAVVVLDGNGKGASEASRWPTGVPVIRWTPGGARPSSSFAPLGMATPSASGLQELAFRVAQAAHGTVAAADAYHGGTRRSSPLRPGSVAGADAA